MRTIHKYPLSMSDEQVIMLPFGARMLSAQMQGDNLCLWVELNPEADRTECRVIEIYGTGNPMIDGVARRHISTVQSGPMVWHVFENIEKEGRS
jgi:hypothetical protein